MTSVVVLDVADCARLLGAGTFGRMAVVTPTGPEIVPVNYRVIDDEVVIRTAARSILARCAHDTVVCFEIDLVDHERWVGWSVVAKGTARVEAVTTDRARTRAPRPWVETEGDVLVRLSWTSLSGRQIGTGWSALLAMPARTTPA